MNMSEMAGHLCQTSAGNRQERAYMGLESEDVIGEDFPGATLHYRGRRALGSFPFVTVCEGIELKAVL